MHRINLLKPKFVRLKVRSKKLAEWLKRNKSGTYKTTFFAKNYDYKDPIEIANYLKAKGLAVENFEFYNEKRGLSKPLGQSLRAIAKKLSYERKLKILKKVAKLIGKMHTYGVVHNDINPSNILIKKNQVYLIDFEFAHRVSNPWTEVGRVYFAFYNDFLNIIGIATLFGLKPSDIEKIIEIVIAQYPLNQKNKTILTHLVKSLI